MTEQLPPQLWESLRAFLRAGKTGQIVLDVKDGQVLAYKLTECGRLDAHPLVAGGAEVR